jgi:type VI secretion system protein ImpC
MDFSFESSAPRRRARDPEQPLRILILSDLSGSTERGDIASRKPFRIDVDSFDARFGSIFPSARLSEGIVLSFESPDDLHPDQIFRNADLFRSFRELRARLADPATFADAAAELGHRPGGAHLAQSVSTSAPGGTAGSVGDASARSDGGESLSDFERLLGGGIARGTTSPTTASAGQVLPGAGPSGAAPSGAGPSGAARSGAAPSSAAPSAGVPLGRSTSRKIDELIRGIVAPHVQAAPDPSQPLLLAAADQAISDTMRAVLAHPSVRQLEAAWLGLARLVRNIGGDNDIEIFAFDISPVELNDALLSGAPRESALHRALVAPQEVPGTTPWSLWVADFTFGASSESVRVLGALGSLAAECGAPLLADASPALVGIESFAESSDPTKWRGFAGALAEAWRALRTSEIAPWIALTAPRILLRLPYGAQTDPTEAIRFEEVPTPATGSYVWGSSAMAVAQVAASEFAQNGWEFSAPDGADIEDLPVHIYREGGETVARATAEAYLPEHAADAILRAGISPILSIRGRNAARVVRVRSISDPPSPLNAPWR